MAGVEQRILSATSQNAQLLKVLAETDYAASALQQNNLYLQNLKNELRVRNQQVANLERVKSKELLDHEKYQHSTMRRLAYKLGGKKEDFAAKAEKEEREYLEAVQALAQAQTAFATLKNNFSEVDATRKELESVVVTHNRAQTELESLYDSIFSGPTPELPEEDAKEWPANTAKQAYDEVQLRVNTETQTHTLLQDAKSYITRCLANLADACDSSKMDIWGIGGRYADMAERSSPAQAQSLAFQVEMLISQAQRLQPLVQNIGHMNIAQGHMMSDVLFDNVFSDISFDNKIWASRNQVTEASRNLEQQIVASAQRLKAVQLEANQVKVKLDVARSELLQVRMAAFERIVSDLPALLAYEE